MQNQRVPFALLLLTPACGTSAPAPGDVPTYAADIAPLIEAHCVACHSPGAIAPVSLQTYDDAKTLGRAIVDAVQTRTMPPWNPDNSGDCQTYANARWLTDDEIDRFARWYDGGMPEGKPRKPLVPPASAPFEATVTLGMQEPYTPQSSAEQPNDDYRCFVVPGFREPTFVTAYELRPGRPSQVHHVIGYVATTPAAEAKLKARDDAAAGPGFPCFGGLAADETGETLGVFGWAPGPRRGSYPEGLGVEIPAAGSLVLEIHYNLEQGAEDDLTEVAFTLAPSVPQPALLFAYDDGALRLPPGLARAEYGHEFSFGAWGIDEPLLVYGVAPHMHLRGLEQRLVAVHASGEETCLMDVPKWDFHWQDLGLYERPLRLAPTDRLRTTCTFDTRSDDAVVTWGEGTRDEMCLSTLLLVRENGHPFSELFSESSP